MIVACVIPSYNHNKHLPAVIDKVKERVDFIVVVDDGSKEALRLDKQEKLFLLRHPINRGQGAALQTGQDFALKKGADIIVHFDADDQFDAGDIPKVIEPIIKGETDVVFGSRFLKTDNQIPWSKKHILMPLGKLVNFLFGVHTSDPQSGFRAYSSKVAKSFRIDNDRMAHCSEILIKLSNGHWRIKEVPIIVRYHEYGQKFSGGVRILKDLFLHKLRQ